MPQLQVKQCPEELYEAVVLSAEMDQRSIAQETVHFLKRVVESKEEVERREAYSRLKAMRSGTIGNMSVEAILGMSEDERRICREKSRKALQAMLDAPLRVSADTPTPAEILEEERR